MLRSISTGWYAFAACGLLAANLFLYGSLFRSAPFTVSVLPSEKGIAALLTSPSGGTVLINAGEDAGILRLVGKELPPWKRNLDMAIITVGNAYAIGGMPDILTRYRVGNIVRFGVPGASGKESALAGIEATQGIREIPASYGTRLFFDRSFIDIISAERIRLSYGSTSLLFTPEMEKTAYILDGKTIRTR